jgi:SAM-dependent methyltransferase
MYVCPDCKTRLEQLYCKSCRTQFAKLDGIPILLSQDKKWQSINDIGAVYDRIYSNRSLVWEDQGRTPEFIKYFSNLAEQFSKDSILEVGCGEGFLLDSLIARNKFAVDISKEALQKTKRLTNADCSVAMAERLPFQENWFDLVVSVGVMEHFLDDNAATSEIRRVLKPGGNYLALIHVQLTLLQRLIQKVNEYIFPRLRPLKMIRWLISKIYRPIHQPIQRKYTLESGGACLERNGFYIDRIISKSIDSSAPLIGAHVIVYISHKL